MEIFARDGRYPLGPKSEVEIPPEHASQFAVVYEDEVWRVYGFFAYRLGDHGLAEDLTQTTFERALRAWSRYDPRRASVKTWLLAIANHVLIDHHRRDRTPLQDPVDDTRLPPIPGPEERASGSPELLSALQSLGERERDVLALRYGANLNLPEVAGLLGLTVANTQQIASRALRRLRALLEPSAPVPAPQESSRPDR